MIEESLPEAPILEGEESEPRPPNARTRTCVGCASRVEDGEELVRLVLGPDGSIAVDAKGGAFGRGAHVHARPDCIVKAAKHGLQKSFKGKASKVSAAELAKEIVGAMDRRVEGLIGSAVRTRRIAFGGDSVTDALRRGDADLVVVASDAKAAADMTEVRRAIADGHAVAWGTKEKIGALLRRADSKPVAVFAALDDRIGGALRSAVHAIDACRSIVSEQATDNAAAAALNAERGA